jgi:single-strand DNA-binding protein
MYETHTIVGYVGGTPDVKALTDGTTVTNFSVAANRKWKDQNGVQQERVTWYRVACWRGLAEVVATYVNKGMLVLVTGTQLSARPYVDRDGKPQVSLELTADDVRFLSGAPDSDRDVEPEQQVHAR